jgi:cell division protein FtsI/penicillin-binding protein 2
VVAERRFGPIVVLLFAGLALILARLFEVQILEHETWGREAQSLVRSSKVVPYHRGRILDREGRVFVKDEDFYQVEFCYRDFRRGHPLGQVAHARSALEMRAVPLAEALAHLEAWALELVLLSPKDIDDFRHGRGLSTASFSVPPVVHLEAEPRSERDARSARGSDLRYYIGEILHVGSTELKHLREREKTPPSELSYAALIAAERKLSPEAFLAALRAEIAASRDHLAFLAEMLQRDLDLFQLEPGSSALDGLVEVLEHNRRRVEDSVADELFAEAAGFAPERLDTSALCELVDVDWIAHMLRWDAARALEWKQSRRAERWSQVEDEIVPLILVRVGSERDARARANRLLCELAGLYLPPKAEHHRAGDLVQPWTELDDLAVLSQLDELFGSKLRSADFTLPRAVLPLQDPDVRAAWRESDDPWSVVGAVSELVSDHAARDEIALRSDDPDPTAFVPPRNGAEAAERWRALSKAGFDPEDPKARAELTWLVSSLEQRFVAVCDRALQARVLAEDSTGPLAFADERVAEAREQEKFIQRDRQNRPMHFPGSPGYDLVHLLARYPEQYRGFDVSETTRRVPVACDAEGRPEARLLVGSVRKPSLAQLFAQSGAKRRLSKLQSKLVRSEDDDLELRDINARLYRRDEYTGGFGVEAYFDRELRGRFGYREIESLEQREEGTTAALFEPPKDGQDIVLTLDLELQRAAELAIRRPEMPHDGLADALWVHNPVGAIVLLTPDGEVLAAASSPEKFGFPKTPGRDAERTQMRERTLQRPTFNPPGSVFKPFVAAYALEHLHFDPHTHFVCGLLPDGKYGYHEMHCHGGHGSCDMRVALAESCNAYFAQLGERFKPEEMIEMMHLFGFDEPTGILRFPGEERRGILENWRVPMGQVLLERLEHVPDRLRFASGLGFIEATPMQVARATAGVLTGKLPEVHIDRSIGGVETPHVSRDLGLSRATLDYIHKALRATVDENGGTAYDKGLDRASLGFGFACKTGTADTQPFEKSPELTIADRIAMDQGKMRKHAWIAGWFPIEDPKAVLVVYLHDVSETASHTAVYVAGQFLRSEAVKKFLAGSSATGKAEPKPGSSPPAADSSPAVEGKDSSR